MTKNVRILDLFAFNRLSIHFTATLGFCAGPFLEDFEKSWTLLVMVPYYVSDAVSSGRTLKAVLARSAHLMPRPQSEL